MLAFVIGLTWSLPTILFTSDFKVYFSADNPQLLAFDKLEETFNRQENIYFYIAPKNKNIFTKKNLSLIDELTQSVLEFSSCVTSRLNNKFSTYLC